MKNVMAAALIVPSLGLASTARADELRRDFKNDEWVTAAVPASPCDEVDSQAILAAHKAGDAVTTGVAADALWGLHVVHIVRSTGHGFVPADVCHAYARLRDPVTGAQRTIEVTFRHVIVHGRDTLHMSQVVQPWE